MDLVKRALYYLTGGLFLATMLSGIHNCYKQELIEVTQNRRTTPRVEVKSHNSYEQEYSEAQQGLDEFKRVHNFGSECKINDYSSIADLIGSIEKEKTIEKIVNPLEWNKDIKNFALEASKDAANDAERCNYVYRYILGHLEIDYERDMVDSIALCDEFKKTHKLKVKDCVMTACFYVACLRSIGIESSVIDVIVDNYGKKMTEYEFRGKKGWGHWSSLVKLSNDQNVIVEFTLVGHFLKVFEMFDVQHRKIGILHDLDVITGYYKKKAYELAKSGKINEAVKVLEVAEKIDPVNKGVLNLLGESYLAQKRYDDAVEQFERIKALDSGRN